MKIRGFEPVSENMRKHNGKYYIPKRSTKGSAGYDFAAPTGVIIPSGQQEFFFTNIKAYMQEDEVLQIYVRSSIGIKMGLSLPNSVGIIDSSYFSNPDNDGNIGIYLKNNTNRIVVIKEGERIAQGIFVKYLIVDNDNITAERNGGFGSTGI